MTDLEKLNTNINRSDTSEPTQEVHAPDGSVSRGVDAIDAIINMQLQRVLRRRSLRGRDPMVAHLLGFFEGEAAEARGRHYDLGIVKLNGVVCVDGDAIARELEGIT